MPDVFLHVMAQKMWSYTRESLFGVRKLRINNQPLENCPNVEIMAKKRTFAGHRCNQNSKDGKSNSTNKFIIYNNSDNC